MDIGWIYRLLCDLDRIDICQWEKNPTSYSQHLYHHTWYPIFSSLRRNRHSFPLFSLDIPPAVDRSDQDLSIHNTFRVDERVSEGQKSNIMFTTSILYPIFRSFSKNRHSFPLSSPDIPPAFDRSDQDLSIHNTFRVDERVSERQTSNIMFTTSILYPIFWSFSKNRHSFPLFSLGIPLVVDRSDQDLSIPNTFRVDERVLEGLKSNTILTTSILYPIFRSFSKNRHSFPLSSPDIPPAFDRSDQDLSI
jgi:hypothetical protein